MLYKDLKLKINKESKNILINGQNIEVLQYLPIKDKIDLIEIALQKSEEKGIYNEMKLEIYFNLYIVFLYTNLEFSEEEKADEMTLYDELESQNIFLRVVNAIPDDEYDLLLSWLQTMKKQYVKYRRSIASLLQTFIQDMPRNAETAAEIMKNFDMNKYKQVINFAEAANGGRAIPISD